MVAHVQWAEIYLSRTGDLSELCYSMKSFRDYCKITWKEQKLQLAYQECRYSYWNHSGPHHCRTPRRRNTVQTSAGHTASSGVESCTFPLLSGTPPHQVVPSSSMWRAWWNRIHRWVFLISFLWVGEWMYRMPATSNRWKWKPTSMHLKHKHNIQDYDNVKDDKVKEMYLAAAAPSGEGWRWWVGRCLPRAAC